MLLAIFTVEDQLVESLTIFNYSTGKRYFSFLCNIQIDSGTHPASYLLGTRADSLRVMCQGHEAHQPLPSNAEVKNNGAIAPLHTHLHDMVLN
jgi:hypothetical protein